MGKVSDLSLRNEVRSSYYEKLKEFFKNEGEDVLEVGSGTFVFPVVDSEQNERFVRVKVEIPLGQRIERNGLKVIEPYDGYAEAEGYKVECADKEIKKAQKAKEKAAKIKKDKAFRAKQAELKAKREEKGGE